MYIDGRLILISTFIGHNTPTQNLRESQAQ